MLPGNGGCADLETPGSFEREYAAADVAFIIVDGPIVAGGVERAYRQMWGNGAGGIAPDGSRACLYGGCCQIPSTQEILAIDRRMSFSTPPSSLRQSAHGSSRQYRCRARAAAVSAARPARRQNWSSR